MADDESVFELPPAEHPIGVYVGLLIAFVILGIGSAVLFLSVYSIFKTQGLVFSNLLVFRLLVMFASAYGAVSSVAALYTMMQFQKRYVKKVDKEFKDFITYARPLVEEIIRQRIISYRITDQLDQIKRAQQTKPSPTAHMKWYEFLIAVALLGNISLGLYLYAMDNPWTIAPYTVIILAMGWWLAFAWYFDLLTDISAFYLPAIYIVMLTPLSIMLRAYLGITEVVFVVFITLVVYILLLYTYYSYISFGTLPTFIPQTISQRIGTRTDKKTREKEEEEKEISKLKEFLPEEEEKGK